jgi:hypothetical protein
MRITPIILSAVLLQIAPGLRAAAQSGPQPVDRFVTFPFPTELVSASTGQRIAWVLNEKGIRNVWAAEGPAWTPKQLTAFTDDDGPAVAVDRGEAAAAERRDLAPAGRVAVVGVAAVDRVHAHAEAGRVAHDVAEARGRVLVGGLVARDEEDRVAYKGRTGLVGGTRARRKAEALFLPRGAAVSWLVAMAAPWPSFPTAAATTCSDSLPRQLRRSDVAPTTDRVARGLVARRQTRRVRE